MNLRALALAVCGVLVMSQGPQDLSDQPMLNFGHSNLTRANFSSALRKHKVALVAFVAPCK